MHVGASLRDANVFPIVSLTRNRDSVFTNTQSSKLCLHWVVLRLGLAQLIQHN